VAGASEQNRGISISRAPSSTFSGSWVNRSQIPKSFASFSSLGLELRICLTLTSSLRSACLGIWGRQISGPRGLRQRWIPARTPPVSLSSLPFAACVSRGCECRLLGAGCHCLRWLRVCRQGVQRKASRKEAELWVRASIIMGGPSTGRPRRRAPLPPLQG
jgi:hypothetical protein